MSGAMREKSQDDFDLERFVDMFDEAMTSNDPRVIETLRRLMMIVVMTRPEDKDHFVERKTGPLRQMYDDVRGCHRRISDIEDALLSMSRQMQASNNYEYQIEQAKIAEQKIAAQTAMSAMSSGAYWGKNSVKGNSVKGLLEK
jgi:hypothetical protein